MGYTIYDKWWGWGILCMVVGGVGMVVGMGRGMR